MGTFSSFFRNVSRHVANSVTRGSRFKHTHRLLASGKSYGISKGAADDIARNLEPKQAEAYLFLIGTIGLLTRLIEKNDPETAIRVISIYVYVYENIHSERFDKSMDKFPALYLTAVTPQLLSITIINKTLKLLSGIDVDGEFTGKFECDIYSNTFLMEIDGVTHRLFQGDTMNAGYYDTVRKVLLEFDWS